MSDDVASAAPGESKDEPFALSARQQELFMLLTRVSRGVAATYRDACRQMHDKPANVVHLTAHLMREMESGLREVCLTPITWKHPTYCKECKVDLEEYRTLINSMVAFNKWNKGVWKGVVNQCPKCGRGVQKAQIQSIISAYEWSSDEGVGKYWLKSGFHEYAHRHGQLEPVPLSDEFVQMWKEFENFLWEVARKLEAQSTIFIDHLEELLAKPEPTKEDVDRLLNKIPANAVNHWHFFNRLEHPSWFEWLEKKGVFARPHAPIDDADSPPWPAGQIGRAHV